MFFVAYLTAGTDSYISKHEPYEFIGGLAIYGFSVCVVPRSVAIFLPRLAFNRVRYTLISSFLHRIACH